MSGSCSTDPNALRVIATDEAPAAIGPYSQAIAVGGFLFCSGQIAIAPESGELIVSNIVAQTRQVLANLDAVLRAGGTSRERVVRCTIHLSSMSFFAAVNAVYAEYFGEHRPARVTVAAAGLPRGVDVEIDAIAALPPQERAC